MQLISSAFKNLGLIPPKYTCDGEDISPPLSWSGVPANARSYALICSDPDSSKGVWYHWAIYDIPFNIRELSENWPVNKNIPPQAINDFDKIGYKGPCPPDSRAHHYHFKIYALSVDKLEIQAKPTCRQIEAACREPLAVAELIGLYKKK